MMIAGCNRNRRQHSSGIRNIPLWTLILLCFSFSLEAKNLCTITIEEKGGVASSEYPLSFGHVFKQGDAFGNVYLEGYTTQTDVKSTWPDGSIKIATISAIVPLGANSTTTLNITDSGTAASTSPLSKAEILATDVGASLQLSNLSGSGYSGNITGDLRAAIQASDPEYWLRGGVVTEILVKDALNPSMDASWEVRIYNDTGHMRISHSIENMKISHRGNITYGLSIHQGNAQPQEVYSKASFQHNHSSRWRKIFWHGPEPAESEIHYDLEYWISTGLIMNYDTNVNPAESDIVDMYDTWTSAETDIMGNGVLAVYFGQTGGRAEIGLLPSWSAMYLLTMDNRMKEMVLGHGDLAGGIPVHYQEDDLNNSFYGRVVNIDDKPSYDFFGSNADIPDPIGGTDTIWTVDRAHQGSFAYLPYLITAEKYYYDEVMYWAGYNLAYNSYRRSGACGVQDFRELIGNKDGSNGILYDQMRGTAWSLRNVSDAAVIADHNSVEQSYFLQKTKNNIQWLYLGNTGENAHGLNAVRVPRESSADEPGFEFQLAPWQHDYLVVVLHDMLRKGLYGNTRLGEVIDTIGKYTAGRFTNDPSFNRWDGAGYWWPLKMEGEVGYFSSGSWSQYYDAVKTFTGPTSGMPHTSFARYDYPYSYAYVARAALSGLYNIPQAKSAFDFLSANLSLEEMTENPAWAFRFSSELPGYVAAPGGLRLVK